MFKIKTIKARRLADDSLHEMPIKSWNYIKEDLDDVTGDKKFELIGWYNEKGELIQGDPNQQAPVQVQLKNVEPVGDGAEVQREPKKRGPKRKLNGDVVLQEAQG